MFGAGSLQVHLTMRRPRAVTTTLLLMCMSVKVCDITACEHIHVCAFHYLYINICIEARAYVCLN